MNIDGDTAAGNSRKKRIQYNLECIPDEEPTSDKRVFALETDTDPSTKEVSIWLNEEPTSIELLLSFFYIYISGRKKKKKKWLNLKIITYWS